MQEVLADLVRRRIKDPVITDAMLSFTAVEVTPDLARARVYVSVLSTGEGGALGGEPDASDESGPTADEVLAALQHSEPFLHREMARQLHMRRIPRLHFVLDQSMAEADRLTAKMREIARSEGRDL